MKFQHTLTGRIYRQIDYDAMDITLESGDIRRNILIDDLKRFFIMVEDNVENDTQKSLADEIALEAAHKHLKKPKLKKQTPKEEKIMAEEKKVQETPKKVSKKRAFTLKQIAEEAGIQPRTARAKLRKAEVPKPEGHWSWDTEEEAEVIRKILIGKEAE